MRAKLSYGQIKFFAHQSFALPFGTIPVFKDNNINKAIDKHRSKIISSLTKRRYDRKNSKNEF